MDGYGWCHSLSSVLGISACGDMAGVTAYLQFSESACGDMAGVTAYLQFSESAARVRCCLLPELALCSRHSKQAGKEEHYGGIDPQVSAPIKLHSTLLTSLHIYYGELEEPLGTNTALREAADEDD
ncbi:hypothetical protein Pelo_14470 [Pelomyxa schiedti]|nr:hypothetical protein Pelo_14470 [Pelomyxa schiedti]